MLSRSHRPAISNFVHEAKIWRGNSNQATVLKVIYLKDIRDYSSYLAKFSLRLWWAMAWLDVVCGSVRIVSRAESGGLVEEDPDYEPGLHLLALCVCVCNNCTWWCMPSIRCTSEFSKPLAVIWSCVVDHCCRLDLCSYGAIRLLWVCKCFVWIYCRRNGN